MKLKAFTLLEVMVGIIIAGFVMGIGYSVLEFSHKYATKSTLVKKGMLDYFEFTSTFQRDAENASLIIQPSASVLWLKHVDHSMTYSFESGYILRELNNHTDTFHLNVTALTVQGVNNSDLINHIEINTDHEQLNFFKEYGAASIITDI